MRILKNTWPFQFQQQEKLKELVKNLQEITKLISYRLQFIDSTIFLTSSWWDLVNNLAEEINKFKWKYRNDDKKCETCRIKYKYCCLEDIRVIDNLIEYYCLCFNNTYQKKFDKNLKK